MPCVPVPVIKPEFVTVPVLPLIKTPTSNAEMDPDVALERLPPLAINTPFLLGPAMLPAFVTVPVPPAMKTPAPRVPRPEMEPPELFVTLPPAKRATPSSTVAMMLPEFVTLPVAAWMMTPSSPPLIELVLVTRPPWPNPTP